MVVLLAYLLTMRQLIFSGQPNRKSFSVADAGPSCGVQLVRSSTVVVAVARKDRGYRVFGVINPSAR